MGRNSYILSSPGFVVDPESVSLNSGRQIDWDQVSAAFGAAGEKVIPAGTIVAELDSGLIVPRTDDIETAPASAVTAPAVGVLVASAHQKSLSDSKSGYGVYMGGVFYETLMPDAGDAGIATFKTELGNRFVFESYADNRS